MSNNNHLNQRRQSLRPVLNRQQDQYKKDLKQLQQLQQINYDMSVLIDMMQYKISMTEENVVKTYNDVVGLIAFKGLALVKHVAEDMRANGQRGEGNLARQEAQLDMPSEIDRNHSTEEENNQLQEEKERDIQINYCEEQLTQLEGISHVIEPKEQYFPKQSQSPQQNHQEPHTETKSQIQESEPQPESTQPQNPQNQAAPNEKQLLKAFQKYQPQLYNQLITNRGLQQTILAQMNVSLEDAKTMIFTLLLNYRSKSSQKRSLVFEQLHALHLVSPTMTVLTGKMFQYPFIQAVSIQLKENYKREQRTKQREEMRLQGIHLDILSDSDQDSQVQSSSEDQIQREESSCLTQ